MLTKERSLELENKITRLENFVNALGFLSIFNTIIISIVYISLVARGF